jgi:three-Cys-motif partner protein
MLEHNFGGDWTRSKLVCLEKYLRAYTTLMRGNPRATYFKTTYVDAFAGSGSIGVGSAEDGDHDHLLPESDMELQGFLKGSARVALEVEPPFDRYVFVETSHDRVEKLELLRQEYSDRRRHITIVNADANEYLRSWCCTNDWRTNRAVVFLDPYGMQVEWKSVETIAKTQAIDLWVLFPLGVGINRVLTRKEQPPSEWGNRLTRSFGTEEWRKEFYREETVQTLFGSESHSFKNTDFAGIGTFFLKQLSSIFVGVAPNPLTLRNSRGNPLYLLCFAVGNPKGAPTAVKIAKEILGKM